MTDKQQIKAKVQSYIIGFAGQKVPIQPLPGDGSGRRYYRFSAHGESMLLAYNPVVEENRAFLRMSQHFMEKGLSVPRICDIHPSKEMYMLEDLGDTTLLQYLRQHRKEGKPEAEIRTLYEKVMDHLFLFQTEGADYDFRYTYPRAHFDEQSIQWDLNYFKYMFLKPMGVEFHENRLEKDFRQFGEWIMDFPSRFFLYRDFQSRNIMLKGNKLYFIDYQGGRQGSPLYDPASILYEAKADLSDEMRLQLARYYFRKLEPLLPLSLQQMEERFPIFVLLRIFQAMGAYGFRGLLQRKILFLQSIPLAIGNLKKMLSAYPEIQKLPELYQALQQLIPLERIFAPEPEGELKVHVNSFSYKFGIPQDSQHGGGFVFDCRSLPNPYRDPELRPLNGTDEAIIRYFEQKPEVKAFLENVLGLVLPAIENYRARGFNSLMVSFGCTGGQHRSVYCARELGRLLQKKSIGELRVIHRELEK